MTSAPDAAWTARAAMTSGRTGATATSREPAANVVSPRRKTVRRPRRSPHRPAGTSNAPKTMAYAFRTHDSVAVDASGKSARRSGIATLVTLSVSVTTNAPRHADHVSRRDGTATGAGAGSAAGSATVDRAPARLAPTGPTVRQRPRQPPLIASRHDRAGGLGDELAVALHAGARDPGGGAAH